MTTSETTTTTGKKRPLQSINTMIQTQDCGSSSPASIGDIVTLKLSLTPENGYVPEHLFDSSGESITFVLGWGNYLPGLHELILTSSPGGMSVGQEITNNVSVDAGFGRHSPDMVIEVPKTNLKKVQHIEKIVPNTTLNLQGGIQVTVLDVTEDTIIVDANHPLAGSSYSCNLKVLGIDRYPVYKLLGGEHVPLAGLDVDVVDDIDQTSSSSSPFEVATFAMGCFWGAELAFMRTPGVVGTRAGYTQGTVKNPSYDEIKEGHTEHRESVMVVYDSRVVSYKELLAVYNERLVTTASEYFKLDIFAEEEEDEEHPHDDSEGGDSSSSSSSSTNSQYKHGIYFHNEEQKQLADEYIGSIKNSRYGNDVELMPAAVFYSAEDHHQQYLYKGGQASRKGCRETIRCYG